MKVFTILRRVPATVWLVSVGACEVEPEPRMVALDQIESAMTQTVCDTIFSCDCTRGRAYAELAECRQDAAAFADDIRSIPAQYPEIPLTYDPSCMGQALDIFANLGCGFDLPVSDSSCSRPCYFYYGSQTVGEPCDVDRPDVSDCAQGLECRYHLGCVDPCDGSSLGQAGQSCRNRPCDEGLTCDFESETCRALPQAGDRCLDGFACADGLFCAMVDGSDPLSERRCFAPRPLAKSCSGHSQCQSGYCPMGSCETLPSEGEACPADRCDAGLDCVEAQCQPADALICWVYL